MPASCRARRQREPESERGRPRGGAPGWTRAEGRVATAGCLSSALLLLVSCWMDQLSAALGSALEEALTGDAAAPLTRDDMARKTREEIEAAVHKALISSQVLDAIRNPDLVHPPAGDGSCRQARAAHFCTAAWCQSRLTVRRTPIPIGISSGPLRPLPLTTYSLRLPAMLIGHVPSQQSQGRDGAHPRHEGALCPACVRTLLVAKADLSLTDSDGRSALHHAASLYDEATLLLLLDHGADLHVEDADGKDALALLERHDIARLTQSFEHYRIEYERRTQIASRIQLYQAGQMPPYHAASDSSVWRATTARARMRAGLRAVEAAAAALGMTRSAPPPMTPCRCTVWRRWSETSHRFCPPCMREAIRTMLLASNRRMEGESCCLPTELWLHVFRHMHRDWFDDADERRRRHAAAQERRAAAVQQRRENERELKHTEEAIRMLEAVIEGDELDASPSPDH